MHASGGLRLGHHVIQRHRAGRELADGFHAGWRYAVSAPLRDSRWGQRKVRSQGSHAAALLGEPIGKRHAISLGHPKPTVKPPLNLVGLTFH